MQWGQNLFKIAFLVLEFHTHVIFEIMLMHETLNSWYKTCSQNYYLAYCGWRARVSPKNNSIKMQIITILT